MPRRVRFVDPKKKQDAYVQSVVSLFRKLGRTPWNDGLNNADIETLVHKLTLADRFTQQELACMSWEQLLLTYGEVVASKHDDCEYQTYMSMYAALSIVAMRLGRCTEYFVHKHMRILDIKDAALRSNRVAVPKLIKLLDMLAEKQSERAYEIPMRQNALLNQSSRLGKEHFQLIQWILNWRRTISIPDKMPNSAQLRIPNMVYTLLGGRNRSYLSRGATMRSFAVTGSQGGHLELEDIERVLGVRSQPRRGMLQGDDALDWFNGLFCAAGTMKDL
ncbi:hypothetical protein BKA56DRAFT_676520 [Ilyonectria sp. MPI-CAGE-AT-0026]|nr:hypothetical protein BKA56DRAFT_676520 [Ilyonectria sp. MPI-CAGE-AT-0026]